MVDERFEFTGKAKKSLGILIVVGVILFILGMVMVSSGSGHEADHGDATAHHEQVEGHGHDQPADHGEAVAEHGEGHGGYHWTKRLIADLWINNIYFVGLSIIGVFFFAVQYAAQVGWSAGIVRIPLSFGAWLPIGGVLMLIVFLVGKHDLFHWAHTDVYGPHGDELIIGKSGFFFWPLDGSSGFPVFYLFRMILFFVLWYMMFLRLKNLSYSEDLEPGVDKWYKTRKASVIFLVIFAFSSMIASWDWIMSIDVHWKSTLFGWYMFASWWVSGLALMSLIVVLLKEKGYLSIVNSNHLHDLGKFMFAFSIFWTYTWFAQFLLIYYANIPEETIYFVQRWKNDHFAPYFFFNLIINFFLPFLLLMTRASKRHSRFFKVVVPLILVGHWSDFYLMVTPSTIGENGGIGFMEIGLTAIYAGAFVFVILNQLAKAPLVAKNHPMLEESLHHHI